MKIVPLENGFKVGDKVHAEAELRLPTAGDIIDAGVDAERAVFTPQGWVLLSSPTLIAQHVLCKQIVRIGEHQGPLTLAELKLLSARDLQLLQEAADALDQALATALTARGRAAAPGDSPGGR